MRIDRINIQDHPPIKSFDIQTSANVVIIAGANGSGKTRLKEAIVNSFNKPQEPQVSLSLTATRPEEEVAWKMKTLKVMAGKDCPALRDYLRTRINEQAYVGTLVQIESGRAVRSVRFEGFPLTTTTADPDEQGLNYSWYLDSLANRWNRLVNNIYKKSAIRDLRIAKFVQEHPDNPGTDALKAYPDIFLPYQELFARLLPGKTLEPIDPRSPQEFQYRSGDSQLLSFGTLSSGEMEVVTMAFDLIYKQITHSTILIDEPELHIHPTLIFRLIETLKSFWGGTNQLVLFTHSADLISTYYSAGNVFVIDPSSTESNQAHQLSNLGNTHSAVARAASANLGIFAVGKRLIFVEGREASVDRLIYHKIAQGVFPNSSIMPIGSVENINALRSVVDELAKSIFGIDLFLIRDRDGLTDVVITSLESNIRFRCLPRRHIENYLLDAEVLSKVAHTFYLPSEKKNIGLIKEALKRIADSSVMQGAIWNVREYIRTKGVLSQTSENVTPQMSLDQIAQNISEHVKAALGEIAKELDPLKVRQLVLQEHHKLEVALLSDEWMRLLPGKSIFGRFCGEFLHVDASRIREAYTDIAMKEKPEVFQDITQIFQTFSQIDATQ